MHPAPLDFCLMQLTPPLFGRHGHRVVVRGQFLRQPTWLQSMLAPSYLNMHLLEDQFFWAYSLAREDTNLHKYRRRVLYGIGARA